MKRIAFLPVVVAVLLAGAATPAPAVEIAGILETNAHALTVDSVIWRFFSEPAPVPELTTGWRGDVNEVDTFQFQTRNEWPIEVTVCFSPLVGGHLFVSIVPVERDVWHSLLGLDPDNAPRVMFQETSYTAVKEPSPGPGLAELRQGATVLRTGAALLAADLPPGPLRAEVFDAVGRPVADHSAPGGRLRLDLAALPAGVYLVRFEAGNGRTTRKLVVTD